MNLTQAEENYLKAILKLSDSDEKNISTNSISAELNNRAASVTDMLVKLSEKKLIAYKKYQGVSLTEKGKEIALNVVRKHRLWEFFLVEKLNFNWDEIHEVAEQLEHIHSELLIQRLDEFLKFPKTDPHGDPIPDEHGNLPSAERYNLLLVPKNVKMKVTKVAEQSAAYLQHLDKLNITIGTLLKVLNRSEFDQSMEVEINQKENVFISKEVAQHIFVQRTS